MLKLLLGVLQVTITKLFDIRVNKVSNFFPPLFVSQAQFAVYRTLEEEIVR